MPPLRLQNARPPEGGHDSRDNSLLTDLVTGLSYLPIGFISAPSTIRNHPCVPEAQVVAGLWTFSFAYPYPRYSVGRILKRRTSRLQVILLAYRLYFSLTRRTSRVLIVSFRNFST